MKRDGLYKQPGSRFWWASYTGPDKKRIRESTGCTNRDDAETYLSTRRVARANGTLNPNAKYVTFEDLMALYEAEAVKNGNRSRPNLTALTAAFAGMLAMDITADRISAWEAERSKAGKKRSTINQALAALRAAFRLAIDAGRLATMPKIKTPTPKNVRTGFFEEKQLRAVVVKLPAWAQGPLLFMHCTGWRSKSEVLPLTWSQVDWDAKSIRLEPGTTKNAQGRTFPFDEFPALEQLLKRQFDANQFREPAPSAFVFPWTNGGAIPYKKMCAAFRQAARRAGHPGLLMHDLRRTMVRNLERGGVSRSVAMSYTGHTTEAVYRRYAIVDAAAQREGIQKLAKIVQPLSIPEGAGV